ncbi:DUF6544 domain-containing protein [Sulfidibacter corallicola]|uniref:Uncharacterized protein n=1 Tax=Sulfidibacter corallicola TaxID=2818388 RepID=A0A8A4TGN6_SULCO|nr:DUF6544 family protein [Sulfidibacter corallicola]QTD48342.1 hypothetical protein J3U87_22410 [Sulfidibacter corallicola]
MQWNFAAAVLFSLLFAMVAVLVHGSRRWRIRTRALHARLEAARAPIAPPTVDFAELEPLPPPVQRYFRAVLRDGQPFVSAVRAEQTGTFNTSQQVPRWKPFTATQRITTRRPGFVWDARVRMGPGLDVHVWDAYLDGEGILTGKVLGLATVVHVSSCQALAEGELMRYFGEATWYPTALLPSQGVRWQAVDERSAKAILRDGDIELTMLFRFDERDLIESFYVTSRGRTVGDRVVATPWEGRYGRYERHGGMLVPIEGEVRWLPPDGPPFPYWRGRLARLEYQFAT